MRRIIPGPSVLQKAHRNLAVLFRTFHNIVEKRNPYRPSNRCRLPQPTPTSPLSPSYNVISIKVCDGLIMATAHACKTTT
jgi:hypothetical protein